MRTPSVWIVNKSGHDYSAAEEFGRLIPLTEGNINPFRLDRLAMLMAEKLKEAADEEDYLLVSGHPVLNLVAGIVWLLHFRTIKLLVFDAKERNYHPATLTWTQFLSLIGGQLEFQLKGDE